MRFEDRRLRLPVFRILFDILSSKVFLLWLVGGWVIYYVITAIWTSETFAYFAQNLRNNLLFQSLYILFLVSGYLNIWRASREIAGRGRLRLLAWLILPAGGIVFLSGMLGSIVLREFEWVIVGQGHTVNVPWNGSTFRVVDIDPGLRERFLDVDVDRGKGIFRYEPKLTAMDKRSRRFEVGAFPPAKIDGTYWHILNFGLAPGVSLLEGGSVKSEGYMPLRILRPGSSDYFEIPPYPYKFLLSLQPARTIQKGMLKASEYDLRDPLYKVRVFEGEKVIAEDVSRNEISFGNISLRFLNPTYWFRLEIVKDPAVPVILAGLALTLFGIPFFLLHVILNLRSVRINR